MKVYATGRQSADGHWYVGLSRHSHVESDEVAAGMWESYRKGQSVMTLQRGEGGNTDEAIRAATGKPRSQVKCGMGSRDTQA